MPWLAILMKLLGGLGAGLKGSGDQTRTTPTSSENPNMPPRGADPNDTSFESGLGGVLKKAGGAAGAINPSAGGAAGGGWMDKLGGLIGIGGAPKVATPGTAQIGGVPDSMIADSGMSATNLPQNAAPVAPVATATPGAGGWMDTLKAWGGKVADYAGQAQDTYHNAILGPGSENLTPEQRNMAIWRSRLAGAATMLRGGALAGRYPSGAGGRGEAYGVGPSAWGNVGNVMAARAGSGANSVATYYNIARGTAPRPLAAPVNREVVVGDNSVQRQTWDSKVGQYVNDGAPYSRWKPGAEKSGSLTASQERSNATQRDDFEWLVGQSPAELKRLLSGNPNMAMLDGQRVRSAMKPMIGESSAEFTARKARLRHSAGLDAAPAPAADSGAVGPSWGSQLYEFLVPPDQSVNPADEQRVQRLNQKWR